MSATDLNLAPPLRDALIGNAAIASRLALWEGEPGVHTRRPVPGDAPYPLAVVNPDSAIGAADYLSVKKPIVYRDIVFYGRQPDQYRVVEELGYLARALFHQQRFSITVPGYHVIEIEAAGPAPAPTDDPKLVARFVALTIQLQELV